MFEPAALRSNAASETVDWQALAEELLDQALNAWRHGGLPVQVARRPRAARWLMRHLSPVLRSTLGDGAGRGLATEAEWLLRWGVIQLRPDQGEGLEGIASEAWLDRPAWRPLLALACHLRLLPVPDFPQRYRRAVGEAPADNLCGLWDVDPSTFYRTLARAQRALLPLIQQPPTPAQRLSLRRFVSWAAQDADHCKGASERAGWHRTRSAEASQRHDPAGAIWHALQATDASHAVRVLGNQAALLAQHPECDALVDRVAACTLAAHDEVCLWLARAALARARQLPEHEESCCRLALQRAERLGDDLLRAQAFIALGRSYEPRDTDRAFACYGDGMQRLQIGDLDPQRPEVLRIRLEALARQAFMRVRQGQPDARALLDETARLAEGHGLPDDLAGLIEQVWAEYWQFADEPERALQARLRALNVFERQGDIRSVLTTYRNLMSSYADARDIDRVEEYAQRIFAAARQRIVEPGILIGTYGNLGYAYGVVGRYDTAVRHYLQALDIALRGRHERFVSVARYNLANAYYQLLLSTQDGKWERLGDEQVQLVLLAPATAAGAALLERTRALKSEVLGLQPETSVNRLLDDETALHLAEMSEIKRHRLAVARGGASAQAHARLAITRAYLTIAAKEREAARELIAREGLLEQFAAELDALPRAFDRDLTREQALGVLWKQSAADLLDDARRSTLLAHLHREGAVNKSGFAALAGVAPATASKHLVMLAERGLLVQRGKGPSTRYELPD